MAIRFLDYQTGSNSPFTAQTVIAASYGLHQVLYQTAVGEGYIARGLGLSPGNLFEPLISLDLGTEFLAQQFTESDSFEQQNYAGEGDFTFQFAPALRRFNAGAVKDVTASGAKTACISNPTPKEFAYPCSILKNSRTFKPLPIP